MMNNRRHTALTAFAAVVLLLGGCGVPTSGPTTRVDQVPDDATGATDEDEPLLPSTNAEETVRSFLGASAGDWSGRDERLNEFVGGGSGKWSDADAGDRLLRISERGVRVKEGANTVSAQVKVTGSLVGTYLTDGTVDAVAKPRKYSEVFELRREDASEVWKLADPDKQVLLSTSVFGDRYQTQSLYFPAKDDEGGTLVPDIRWLPKAISNEQERYSQLADWLLSGPSERISHSVDSSFPRGATRKSVSVSKTKVTVDVSSESASQEMGAPDDMSAQLSWSLGLNENQELSLLVEGQERMSSTVASWSNRDRSPSDDADAGSLVYFLSDGIVQADDPEAPFAGEDFKGIQSATLEPGTERLAGVAAGESGMKLVTGQPGKLNPVKKFSGTEISDPQWFSKKVLLALTDGKPKLVDADSGSSKTISLDKVDSDLSSVSLSPDARRLAYVVGGKAYVAPITNVEGLSIELGDAHRIGVDVDDIRDIDWSQETRLLMIGSVEGSEDWLWEVSIDNAYQEALPGARDSAAVADELAVRCASPKGTNEPGQPIVVALGNSIQRVFSDTLKPVSINSGKEKPTYASGYAPFTAGLAAA